MAGRGRPKRKSNSVLQTAKTLTPLDAEKFPGLFCQEIGLTKESIRSGNIREIPAHTLKTGVVIELWKSNKGRLKTVIEWIFLLQPHLVQQMGERAVGLRIYRAYKRHFTVTRGRLRNCVTGFEFHDSLFEQNTNFRQNVKRETESKIKQDLNNGEVDVSCGRGYFTNAFVVKLFYDKGNQELTSIRDTLYEKLGLSNVRIALSHVQENVNKIVKKAENLKKRNREEQYKEFMNAESFLVEFLKAQLTTKKFKYVRNSRKRCQCNKVKQRNNQIRSVQDIGEIPLRNEINEMSTEENKNSMQSDMIEAKKVVTRASRGNGTFLGFKEAHGHPDPVCAESNVHVRKPEMKLKPTDTKIYPGVFCKEIGLTKESIRSGNIREIPAHTLKNGVVIELRKFNKGPPKIVTEWVLLLQPHLAEQMGERAVNRKVLAVYKRHFEVTRGRLRQFISAFEFHNCLFEQQTTNFQQTLNSVKRETESKIKQDLNNGKVKVCCCRGSFTNAFVVKLFYDKNKTELSSIRATLYDKIEFSNVLLKNFNKTVLSIVNKSENLKKRNHEGQYKQFMNAESDLVEFLKSRSIPNPDKMGHIDGEVTAALPDSDIVVEIDRDEINKEMDFDAMLENNHESVNLENVKQNQSLYDAGKRSICNIVSEESEQISSATNYAMDWMPTEIRSVEGIDRVKTGKETDTETMSKTIFETFNIKNPKQNLLLNDHDDLCKGKDAKTEANQSIYPENYLWNKDQQLSTLVAEGGVNIKEKRDETRENQQINQGSTCSRSDRNEMQDCMISVFCEGKLVETFNSDKSDMHVEINSDWNDPGDNLSHQIKQESVESEYNSRCNIFY